MKLYETKTVRSITGKYGFRPLKGLGQNFLTDKDIADKIIEAADISRDDLIIEIGPGLGVLTREAARLAEKVAAIEIDRRLIPILNETLAGFDNIQIINDDVLKTDLNEIIDSSGCKRAKIIGNLPYYITTPVIMELLQGGVKAESIVIMVQKEVACRIESGPGSRVYGALSAAAQYYCHIIHVADAPGEAFFPVPKTDSAVLKLLVRKEPPVNLRDKKMFFACIRAGFGQRRKTLLNSLAAMGTATKEEIRTCLAGCGIDQSRRAETLSLKEFAEIANGFTEIRKKAR